MRERRETEGGRERDRGRETDKGRERDGERRTEGGGETENNMVGLGLGETLGGGRETDRE